MAGRFAEALAAARRASAPRPEAQPVAPRISVRPGRALLALGLDIDAVRDLAGRHVAAADTAGMRPVLISDHADADLFRRPGLVCEYVAPAAEIAHVPAARPDTVALYRLRRLEIMFDRWTVIECLLAGPDAADLGALREENPRSAASRIRFAVAESML